MSKYVNWIWPQNLISINKKNIENVCFKGGGMKGTAFVGVDRALTELNVWPQIKRFIGSSAGAIFASAAACRISHTDLAEIIDKTDFSKFKDAEWGIAGEGYRLIEELGMYKGEYFYNWYGDILEKYVRDRSITFQGVYERFGTELVITTTDLTDQKLIYMDRYNYPNLQIRDAVRQSMSIPVFYVPVTVIDDKGVAHIMVDGGCTNNYPLNYFDYLYSSPEEAFGKTIGFDLEDDQIQNVKINNVLDLVTQLINTAICVIEKVRLTPEDKYRSIAINTNNYKSTDFDMPKHNITQLIENGYNSTIKFFSLLK